MILLLSIHFSNKVLGLDFEAKSNIKKVTVFSLGATVTHEIDVSLPEGQSNIILKNVSSYAIENSIQLLDEDITLINVKLIKKFSKEEVQRLKDEKDSYLFQLEATEKLLLNSNQFKVVNDFKELLSYYDTKVTSFKSRIRKIESDLEKDSLNTLEPYFIFIVSTNNSIKKKLRLKYVTGSAAWVPEYEVFVDDLSKDIKLKYIAKIMNKTGEDWNDVEVELSFNSPFDKTSSIPKVEPFYLGGKSQDYGQENSFLPFPYESNDLDILKISGVEYEEFNAPSTTELLQIEGINSIPSNGGIYKYDVFSKTLETIYMWYSFPSIEENPYLVARVINWNKLPIADGDAKIYYQGNNIGDSYISIEGLPDTLDIPIGQNKEVIVQRNPIGNKTFTKESNNKVKETIYYDYVIKSNRNESVKVKIFDQIPVSQSNRAKVSLLEKSNAVYNDENGILVWQIDELTKNKEQSKTLGFEVEYEKNYRSSLFGSSNKSNFYSQNYSFIGGSSKKVRAKF